MTTKVAAPRARKSFSRLKHVLDLPNLIDIQKASFDWFKNEGLKETIADISPIEDYTGTLAVEFGDFRFGDPPVSINGVPREGPHLPGPAQHDRPLRQQGDGRDPRAERVHGRLPDDDGRRDVHHQRHRARHRHAARAVAGRLPDGAQGRDEAGLHREPDAGPRLVARARDRQEGHRLRPHRPEAEAPDHDAAARPPRAGPVHGLGARHDLEREDPRALRQQPLHRDDARQGPLHARGGGPHRGLQEAAPGRAADGGQRPQPAQLAVLRPQALRPDEGRPLQAEPAPRRGRAGGHPRPHDAGHHRARPPARLAPERDRRPGGLEGLRRRRGRPVTATRSGPSSTSTSTSATGACARSAS